MFVLQRLSTSLTTVSIYNEEIPILQILVRCKLMISVQDLHIKHFKSYGCNWGVFLRHSASTSWHSTRLVLLFKNLYGKSWCFLKERYCVWVECLSDASYQVCRTDNIEFITFHCNHFFFSFFSLPIFFQTTVRMGLDEEGGYAVSVLFVFYLKMFFLLSKWSNMQYIFKSCCWQWCFGCARRRHSFLFHFL